MDIAKSAYIHVPFCNSKCFYCAFISTCNLKLEQGYLIALLKDIDTNYKGNCLDTLYFGGGTPSILPIEHVEKIIKKFRIDNNAEVTFELNPENSSYEYLKGLINIGINRLSIGIQSFDDKILKLINRKHTASDAINAIKTAQDVGFKNISVDLIYGLPTQTVDNFEFDINTIKSLNVQHISLYGLKIEDNSYFGKNLPNNLPDDDIQADMYLKAVELLNDYEHYEISNFAQKGFESKHNTTYWNNETYYGFGCAAHGYEDGIRYANLFDIKKYMESPLIRAFAHFETEKEKLEEEIFLGFRRSIGINVNDINKKYNINFEKKYSNILNKYLNTKHLIKTNYGYALTNKGFLISTVILADFI